MTRVRNLIPVKEKPLNPRIMRFIEGYLQHGNASKAMVDAGYSPATANKSGYLMLRTKRVKDTIERLRINSVSKGYVLDKYREIVQRTTEIPTDPLNLRVAVEGLKGISAIQGYNAPTKTESLTISGTLDDMRAILDGYRQDE